MALPHVSICVPALNEECYLGETLRSLTVQEYPRSHYEIIVVVDSETSDGTAKICREYDVRVLLDDQYHSISGATHLGFMASQSDIVASTHADTSVPRTWLRRIVHNLYSAPDVGGVGGPLLPRSPTDLKASIAYNFTNAVYRLAGRITGRVYLAGPNYAYRRTAYVGVGGHDIELLAGEDNDLAIRIGAMGWRVIYDPRLVVYTSDRRLRDGYLRCVWRYGRLFCQINLRRRPARFNHVR